MLPPSIPFFFTTCPQILSGQYITHTCFWIFTYFFFLQILPTWWYIGDISISPILRIQSSYFKSKWKKKKKETHVFQRLLFQGEFCEDRILYWRYRPNFWLENGKKVWTKWDRGLGLWSGAFQHLELRQRASKEGEVIEIREKTEEYRDMEDQIK